MTQNVLYIITAFLMLISPIFKIEPTPVAMPEDLACESEPSANELYTFDRINGVNNSTFYIKRPNSTNYKTVNASWFGLKTESYDNYSAFCKAIEYCKNNPNTRLVVDGGKYHFRTDDVIRLDGVKNLMIDADGAQFIFENANYFSINSCDCIEFKGLSITWNFDKSRLGSIVKIKNASRKSHSFEIEFTELEDVDEDIPIMVFTQYDPETLTPGVEKDFKECYVYSNPDILKSVEKTGRNVLKITHNGDLDKFRNGEVFMLRHHVYDGNAFNVYNTSNITFSNVKLYAIAGMGWLIENRSERFQLLDCIIGLDPDHVNDHRISATADGAHIANTNGKFRISGCDFSFMGDDAVNVHDNVAMVTDVQTEKSASIYTNANNFKVGDTAVFCDKGYKDLGFSTLITAVEGETLTFEKNLPAEVGKGCIVYNGSLKSDNYVINSNYFHENRARGLLLQSNNGLCENNRFYKIMANPIKVVIDISSGNWLEGTGVNGLVIKNNSFIECNVARWNSQIEISTNIDGDMASLAMFHNIVIENNSFENFYGKLIDATNVSNLEIIGNRINNTMGSTQAERGRICIGNKCSKVTIKDNEYKSSLKAPFQKLIRVRHIKSVL